MNLFEYYKNLTDTKIGKIIGINPGTVGQYRKNQLIPSSETIIRVYKITKGKVRPQDWFKNFLNSSINSN